MSAVSTVGFHHPYRAAGRPLHLRDSQYRGRGPEGRGRRSDGPLSQHRRSHPVRLRDAAAPDRGGRQGDARRPQRLHRVAGHRRGARGRGRRFHRSVASDQPRSRAHHLRHLGGHRAGADARSWTKAKRCSCRRRPIRSTPRCWRRSARHPCTTGPITPTAGCRTSITSRRAITPKTRALVVIDPNNPTGAIYPDEMRRALIALAERHGLVILADEVYGDLAYDGSVAPMAILEPGRGDHFVLEPVEGLPRARMADRLDGRRPLAAPRRRRSPRSRSSPTADCAAPARCSTP